MSKISKLRDAQLSDAAELVRIAVSAITESGYTDEQIAVWASGLTIEKISACIENDLVLVVEQSSNILGFASLTENGETAGEIDLLYVDPKYSRRGVGRLLIRALEDTARQQEMSQIWVDASEPATYRLSQLGYHVHDRYKKTVSDVVFRNTWMLKSFT